MLKSVLSPLLSPVLSPLSGKATTEPNLLDSLVAWWSLDETNGIRFDSHDAHSIDLTDINTVGSVAGKVGSAANFIAANNESLEYNGDFSMFDFSTTGFTVSLWVNPDDTVGEYNLINRYGGSNSQQQFALNMRAGTGLPYLRVRGTVTNNLSGITPLTATVFNHLVIYADLDIEQIGIVLNNGTPDIKGHTYGVQSVIYKLWLGGNNSWDALNGSLDEVGIWNRVLTLDEISELYNDGNGIGYPG
jgi:hypothetical protein